ncbi:hypothetical protein ACNOYE_16050 [Nannocystaceae bacterium ST9]
MAAGLLTALACGLGACSIIPEEIDYHDEAGDDVGDTSLGDDGGTDSTGETTSQDASTGDGDGDGDTTDTNATDGSETGTLTCEPMGELVLGPNAVEIVDASASIEGSCGGVEGEAIYSFTASSAGTHVLALSGAEFSGVLYALGADCTPIDPCAVGEEAIQVDLLANEVLLVVVDSDSGAGAATLTITGP